jgi:hypothetical protein
MTSSHDSLRAPRDPSVASDLSWGGLWLAWQLVRILLFTFLRVLQPFLRIVLSAAALLGVLMAFFFRLLGNPPDFPFWHVLALSTGCALLLTAYDGLIRLLSR